MKKFFSLFAAVLFAGMMMAADVLSVNFKADGQGDWTIDNKVLPEGISYVWTYDSKYGMKASAFVSGSRYETEAWLVSPAIDFSGVSSPSLTVKQALNYATSEWVSILAKAGEGDWTALDVQNWPAGNSWTFVESTADLTAFAGKADVQLAFKYTSSTSTAATWEIESLAIVDGAEPVVQPDVVFTGADFAGQGTETSGSEVTATKDGVTFTCNKGYSDDAHSTLRCYKNGVITITSETEQIGKLVFQFYSTYTGDLSTEVVVNANEWTYTLTNQARIEKLSVYFGEYEKPEPVDPDSITVARALEIGLALAQGAVSENEYVITGYVSNIVKPYSEQYGDETFWITDEKGSRASSTAQGAFEIYQCKPNTGAEIGYDAKIRILCKIKNYNGTIENNGRSIEFEVLEQGHELVRDTISVARALEIGATLEDNATTNDEYVISGYVSSIESYYDTNYGNETFWIADEKGSRAASNAAGAFYVFRGKLTPAEEMWTDAKVYVTCRIKKYVKEGQSPVIENEKANDAVEVVEKGEEEIVEAITVAQAVEIGTALADGAVSEKRYEITGYVSFIVEAFSEQYGNETFWITDEPGQSASKSADNAFEIYRGKPNPAQEVGFDGKVKIVCKIKNFKGTIENDGMNLPFELLEPGTFSIDTINVATAIETTQAMEQGLISREFYAVKGYVANVSSPYDAKYSNMSFYMTDDFSATEGDFQCYRAKVAEEDSTNVVQGAYVIVTGHLDNNSHGIQMASGASVVVAEAPKMDTINIARALEIGAALEDNTATKDPYIVVGYVASIDVPYEEEIQSFSLSDSNEAVSGDFKAVNAFIDEPGAELHNRIAITGYIQKVVSGNLTQIRMEKGKAQIIPEEGIKHINASDSVAKKVVIDGVIYIVRDNKVFNLQGAQVR